MDSTTQILLTKNLLTVALSNAKETEEYYDRIGELIGIDVRHQDSNQLNHRHNVWRVIVDTLKSMIGEEMYEEYEDEIQDYFLDLLDENNTDIDGVIEFFNDVFDCIDRNAMCELNKLFDRLSEDDI